MKKHEDDPVQGGHRCDATTPFQAYGEAITECYEAENGHLYAGNGEYGSEVNYCPYCGFKALKPARVGIFQKIGKVT